MKVACKISVENGKVKAGNDKVVSAFASLNNGEYILEVRSINPLLSPRQCQDTYFGMVDIVAMDTGNDRYTVHDGFKAKEDIPTTKDLPVEEWQQLLEKFRWWAFNEFDIIV